MNSKIACLVTIIAVILPFNFSEATIRALEDITGKNNHELFKHYRCRVCEDLMVDNLELADGEIIINEKLAIKFCETFMKKILHNALGGVVCHTVVQSKLDQVVKTILTPEIESKVGEQICRKINFCD